MKWRIRRVGTRWWAVGMFVHVFDTWEDAIDWIETQRYAEPTG